MNVMNLKTIKWESVKSIFGAIAGAEQISRAQISAITGLSLVTVGKVADALLDMDIITQEKQVKVTAGRRAGLLTINKEKFVLILDLSSRVFRYSVLNLNLELLEKTRHTYDDNCFYEENLHNFLTETSLHITQNYNMENCFGIGVSLPGRYDVTADRVIAGKIPEIADLSVKAKISDFFPDKPIFLEASENVAALSNIAAIPNYAEKNILYWFLGEENTTGSLMVNGSFIHGKKQQPCDFGPLTLCDGRKLGDVLKTCETPEDISTLVSYPLHSVIQILAPEIIILECEHLRQDRERIVPLIQQELCNKYGYDADILPELIITRCKFRHSHRGLAMRLREMWVDSILMLD